MSQDTVFDGEIDPEIAALIGAERAPSSSSGSAPAPAQGRPDFSQLFGEGELESLDSPEAPEVDLTATSFPEITHFFEETPRNDYRDPDYYKKVLSGEGEKAQRLHGILQKYIAAKDPKDRGVYRMQIVTAYWDFLASVAIKAISKLADPKRFALRFGILHPTFLSGDDLERFASTILDNDLGEPIYYLDEWFKAVGTGAVKASTTDEVRIAKSNETTRLQQLLDKAIGKRDGARNLLKAKCEERSRYEEALKDRVDYIRSHTPIPDFPDLSSIYDEAQRRAFTEIQEILRELVRADRELAKALSDFEQANADVETLQGKVSEAGGGVSINLQAVETEFETARQMAKLTVGRQGNHFPILTREYFHCGPFDLGTRENVLKQLAWIESVDSEAYCRSYKGKLNRIVPFVILIPGYGEFGVCWEPFDRYNRATSRGRIAVPMYPKNLQMAVITAVADLRWQVAKEKASYYWMEEGLTGNYYQWFVSKKLKGDVKEAFIGDYVIWVTKESEGTQRLDKEVRGIFWRYLPFTQEIKDKLKNRSYVYQELYQRDVNRSLSDGY